MRNICNYTFWIFSVIVFWAFYEYGKKSTKALGLEKDANKEKVKILEVMSSQAFMILQTVKDHREFSRKVPEEVLSRYSLPAQEGGGGAGPESPPRPLPAAVQAPSERFYRMTKMTDRQAMDLPVKKFPNTNRSQRCYL